MKLHQHVCRSLCTRNIKPVVNCRHSSALQDIRRIVRNDSRIINKLHRRVFMDKISLDDVKIYVSFYCEASNRDAFMAIKQVRSNMLAKSQ
jgi:hypothetical protein